MSVSVFQPGSPSFTWLWILKIGYDRSLLHNVSSCRISQHVYIVLLPLSQIEEDKMQDIFCEPSGH